MSPVHMNPRPVFGDVPRASGDEPGIIIQGDDGVKCSPRERG